MIAPASDDEGTPEPKALLDDHGRPIDLRSVAIVLWHKGWTNRRIGEALGKSDSTIGAWLKKALEQGRLDPLPRPAEFGLRVDCRCIWSPIRPGEPLVCVNCCESGYDFHARMQAEPLPKDRKAYRPTALMGGSGSAAADESAGQHEPPEVIADDRMGRRYGHRMNSRGRRR